MGELQASLRRLERRDWALWAATVVVTLLLTLAVVSFSLPHLWEGDEPTFQFNLSQNIRGLVAVVLLFNLYGLCQQIVIKRLRRQLAEQAEVTRRLEVSTEEYRALALHDPLTGLFNRRLSEELLMAEATRSKRHGHPLAVVTFDLNDFKQINDRFGHGVGDLVLKEFAERLKKAIRSSDVAARIGGDEFLVLLPECHPGRVGHVLARLASLKVDFHGQKIPFTCAGGWADYQAGEPIEEFLERADQMLYANKRAQKSPRAPSDALP